MYIYLGPDSHPFIKWLAIKLDDIQSLHRKWLESTISIHPFYHFKLAGFAVQGKITDVPPMELTCPTLGKGKSSSLGGDMFVSRMVFISW